MYLDDVKDEADVFQNFIERSFDIFDVNYKDILLFVVYYMDEVGKVC